MYERIPYTPVVIFIALPILLGIVIATLITPWLNYALEKACLDRQILGVIATTGYAILVVSLTVAVIYIIIRRLNEDAI